MANTTQIDGRLIAEKNELRVLNELNDFGWLTTKQIARLVWPGLKQSRRMAQRTVSRLLKAKMIVRRKLPYAVLAYVLSSKGAAFLREKGVTNAQSQSGRDLSLEKPRHRAISNDFLIDRKFKNAETVGNYRFGIFTEHEIQRLLSPRLKYSSDESLFIPDGLWFQDEYYTWIEVENASKSRDRLDRIINFANTVLTTPKEHECQYGTLTYNGGTAGWIQNFLILCPNNASYLACLRAIERYGIGKLSDDFLNYFSIARVNMSASLKWGGVTKVWSITDLLNDGLIKDSKPENPLLQQNDG